MGKVMDFRDRAKQAKTLAGKLARERLCNLNYSLDVLQAFDHVNNADSDSGAIPLGVVLMDVAWQISGNIPSEKDLAVAFFPINSFFQGTVYQDDLLDSLSAEKPRTLVKNLGMSTSLIMGNVLYCEALVSLINMHKNDKIIDKLLKSAERLVRYVMDSEIVRRNHTGKILPFEEFLRIWRRLTPNRICIEIGGILGNSDEKEIQILTEIGANISLTRRILKEINEMYGLKGPLKEKLPNKPPPLPVTLAFELSTSLEKNKLEEAIKRYSSMDSAIVTHDVATKEIELLIDIVAKYNSINTALKIHRGIINETRELIAQISNSEHRDVLTQILGSEVLNTS
ncbi:hypothetical protein CEE45_02365 [Candidatus Heimdallarchaeota archaeon B3_Heim]|nr:MAG: hypothetical protein CEE45_02365 [Candidatus Heimdallarchaeota archaeon B3_Heim]